MISIGEGWSLKTDKDCVTVYKEKINKKTGTPYRDATFYYNTFEQALEGLMDRAIQDMNLDNLRTICLEIRKAKDKILEQLKEGRE